jgi:glycosyltransferase involved in cell wall biosynthesis
MSAGRVALVEFFGIGGTADYTDCLASALSAQGLEVAVITSSLFTPLSPSPSYRVARVFHYRPEQPKPWKAVQLARGVRTARKWLRRFNPDVVHAQGTVMPIVEGGLYRQLPAARICTVHDARAHERRPWLGSFTRFYQGFDRLICHSSFTQHAVAAALPKARIDVVPHGVYAPLSGPLPDRAESRRRLGLPQDSRIVLFFGFIRQYKGLEVLLEALALAGRRGDRLHGLVAGRPLYDIAGPVARAARERIPVTFDLRFIPRDEFATYFAAADVVALPYRETFDSGALELAAAFGKPVVVSDAGGLREAFARYGYGTVLAASTPQALADALLADYPAPAGTGSENSWDAVAERTRSIYAEALHG